jgi:acetyl esterase/lipase
MLTTLRSWSSAPGAILLLRTWTVAALLAALPLSLPARASEPPAPAKHYEVQVFPQRLYYDVAKDPDRDSHRLDVFSPKGKTGCPTVFFVHGGAWLIGRKDNYFGIYGYGTIARCLAERGLVVVLPNYRLSPGVRHPEHIKDVARAFAWTCRNAARYGGDPAQIFLCGHSAGGHLVTLLATDESYLKKEGRSRQDIRGVVSISGVYCLEDLELKMSAGAAGDWLHVSTRLSPFAVVFGSDPETFKQASPITHVGPDLPPFLLMNAGLDYWPLRKMTRDFAAALQENCCEVWVKEVPWRTHETLVFDILHQTAEPIMVEAVVDFIDRHRPAGLR